MEAESSGVPVTLAVNKIDLQSDMEVFELSKRLSSWGYQPRMLSCHSEKGLTGIDELLKDRVSVVIGPSGD